MPPKGCKAWMRPNSHSWHRYPHRIGPSCRKSMTDTARIGYEILRDRAIWRNTVGY